MTSPWLVDRDWLEQHLHDDDVLVVEVDVSAAAYVDWHIEGAVLWNAYSDLKDPAYHPVGDDALSELFARSGIGPDTTVVFYGYAPCLGFWLAALHGHAKARVLNCSRDTWRSGGGSCSTRVERPAATTVRHTANNRTIRADQTQVLAAIGKSGTVLVDARTTAEYRGERFWPSGGMEPGGRAGHIPSAVHQPLDGIYQADGSFRPVPELERLFSWAEKHGDAELVTYCTIGGRAATAWFVLTRLLGRDGVRVYDGSWAEWGRIADVPVAGALTTRTFERSTS